MNKSTIVCYSVSLKYVVIFEIKVNFVCRPFSVQKIPHSNLILLVVDTLCPCGAKRLDVRAREAPARAPCRRLAAHHRRRPAHCGSYHPEVSSSAPALHLLLAIHVL